MLLDEEIENNMPGA